MGSRNIAIIALWLCMFSSTHYQVEGSKNETLKADKKTMRENGPPSTEVRSYTVESVPNKSSNQSTLEPSLRVVGGDLAGKDEFPYIVSISDTSDKKFVYAGGVIIAPQWILTAYHVVEYAVKKMKAHILATPKYNNRQSVIKFLKKYRGIEYYCPPEGDFVGGDIALVKLAEKIPLNRKPHVFKKIEMIKAGQQISPRQTLTVAGWGAYKMFKVVWPIGIPVPAEMLMKADIKIRPDKECYKNFLFIHSAPKKFCTLGSKKSSCKGDSGGPVVMRQGGKEILVGIASASTALCE
ncbi:trypsin-like [Brevipalpus obovatus]|uniref:trypsin-like n=1 Tax=Brevipalpus obovatus TaxID=246614 RepID=UPI003D9EC169